MNKLGIAFVGVLVLFAVIIGRGIIREQTRDAGSDKPVVKIGAILPMTGNIGVFGQSYKNGLILAQKHLKKDTKYDYRLIIEDSMGQARNVPLLARRLLDLNKVDAGLSMWTGDAMIVSPIFSQAKKVHIASLSWFPDKFLKDKYNFHIYANMQTEVDLLVGHILKKGYKNIAMVAQNIEGGLDGHRMIKESFRKNNIKLCGEIISNPGTRDFRIDIMKVQKACRPELYIFGALPPESDIFLKQLYEIAGKPVDITGLDLGMVFSSPALCENHIFPMMALPSAEWLRDYEAVFGDDLYVYASGVAYDSFNMLVDAYENAPTQGAIPSGDDIADYIHAQKSFPSAFGGRISVQPNGQIDTPVDLLSVKDGQFVRVDTPKGL
ncbi:MAG: ABC transporter substrate-binding protein [Alphaproteobacteria bacterium]|nr:ABC transporter substrate-binding protein [Alphaproteobacteria bacterium]